MTALALLSLAKRLWPLAAIVGVALALWAYGSHRYHQGVLAERATWQALATKATSDAVALARARQDNADLSAALATERAAGVATIAAASRPNVRNYYATNPTAARVCLDDSRVLDIAKGDAALIAAARATGDRPAAVRDTAAVVGR